MVQPFLDWTLKVFNNDSISLSIFAFFAISMFLFFINFLIHPTRSRHGQTILTIGILGTFVGIAWGLWNFQINEIDKSIGGLLSGLKTAFFTSILGMFFSILIKILERGKKTGNAPLDLIIQVIESSSNKLCEEIPQKIGQIINQNIQEIRSLNNTTQTASDKMIQSIKETNQENQNNLIKGFQEINSSLSKVVDEISKGASETIIQALKQTMETFNEDLKQCFGDNFNKLNKSCSQMIEWQEQYKNQVIQATENLKIVGETLRQQSETHEMMRSNIEESNVLLKRVEKHIQTMNKLLQDHEGLPDRVSNTISNVKEGFENINNEMKEFSKTIQNDLRKQYQSINKITGDLDESLKQMNGALTALTEDFAEKYKEFIRIIDKIVEKNSRTN